MSKLATVADPTLDSLAAALLAAHLPALIGKFAKMEATLWARLMRESAAPARSEPPAEANRVLAAEPAAPARSQDAGGLLTQKEAAAVLAVSPRTLEGWRVRGGGPRFVRLGRSVRYRRDDLEAYLRERTRRSTSEDAAT